jgi:polyisoprenoid-binding protein YceI
MLPAAAVRQEIVNNKGATMLCRFTLFVAMGFIAGTAFAAPESYTVDPRHTFPSFEVNHLGFSTQRGRFDKTRGRIILDRQAQQVSAEITIDAATIDTGLDELEARLRKPDFFDVERYPTIMFRSTRAHFDGETLVGLDGELTMHGVTRPLRLEINNFKCGNHPFTKKPLCSADVSGTLKRSDFGIKSLVPMVGDEVKLLIQVEAYKGV